MEGSNLLPGEYVEVEEAYVYVRSVIIIFDYDDDSTIFVDMDRFESLMDIEEYLEKRIPNIHKFYDPMTNGGKHSFSVVYDTDVDIPTELAKVQALIEGRQEWRGVVPFEDELEEEML